MTQSDGSQAFDASVLLMPLIGFLSATDPRVQGTIEAVQGELGQGGLLARYAHLVAAAGEPGQAPQRDGLSDQQRRAQVEPRRQLPQSGRVGPPCDPGRARLP